jgi:hypothetical protein
MHEREGGDTTLTQSEEKWPGILSTQCFESKNSIE